MTTEKDSSVLSEVHQRVRRIETRLMRLCAHVGVDATGGTQRGNVVYKGPDPYLELQGFDVSIADCLRICQGAGIVGGITLSVRGDNIGILNVPGASQ
jgi:hypothetical protein